MTLEADEVTQPIARWVADFASASSPGRVLDVGCGARPYEAFFRGWEYVGIDVEESGRPTEHKRVDRFFDGISIPYPDASFDAVLCTEVLEHCIEPEALVSEMHRILKPGGAAVITVPFMWGEHETPYDFRRYSTFGVTRLLESAGLLVESLVRSQSGVEAVSALVSSEINHSLRAAEGKQSNWLRALVRWAERYLWAALQRIWRSEYRFARIYIDNLVVARRRPES